jgi:hypothetical protein
MQAARVELRWQRQESKGRAIQTCLENQPPPRLRRAFREPHVVLYRYMDRKCPRAEAVMSQINSRFSLRAF